MLYGGDESLYCTPEIDTTLYVNWNDDKFKTILKNKNPVKRENR